jgi:YesN/AraC family two-component response regulator
LVVHYGIDKLFADIEDALRAESPESEYLVKLYLGLMLASISKLLYKNDSDYQSDDRITKLIYYINENLSEDLSYDSLSKIFYINKNHLGFMFKRQTGIPLGEYIKHKRIIKAKNLLLSGMPAMQAAKKVGFNDYPTFYRMFKLLTGNTPREFSR